MNDQPEGTMLNLNVNTILSVTEADPIFLSWDNPHIVDLREGFNLEVNFNISGPVWDNIILPASGGLNNIVARFEAAGDCIGGPDVTFIPKEDSLNTLQQPDGSFKYLYKVDDNVITHAGVYEVVVVLTLKNKTTEEPFSGMLGFAECKILVHEQEQI